ncbi:GGDEF domain-containing protein [Denitrobaculum tricleocarpae]|uniref:diguanylate cyclase n=1 Tax=Denitrobaculum tricleocarpae TaxID=2591009 RepID=A0A545TU08_9PROT|nr:GGDEF domain-containing protein [Denitrobaculum tricleocarpae]TQV80705.1 GGDEF domain-containing protein [Denitrobaculum tricleocarpae]
MTDDFDHSEKIANAAFAEMRARKIPMTPENFNIWYDYCNGGNPVLSKAVERLVEKEAEFTDAENADLYIEHFGVKKSSQDLHQVGGQIQSITEQVVTQLKSATDITTDYSKTLGDFSGELAKAADRSSDQLNGVIRDVMVKTQKVAQRNKDLEARLHTSAHQIDGLHEDLIKARQEAQTDGLTGLANRKCFDARLAEGMSSSEETGEELSLMLMDIDHFKTFNDTHGHQIGDQVLKLVAQILNKTFKGQDTAARYGGEEFAVILPNTKLDIAVKLAENIRVNLANQVLKNLRTGESFGKLTVSVGVARYHAGEPPEDLIQRSDKALYKAKQDGRNRVVSEKDNHGKSNFSVA